MSKRPCGLLVTAAAVGASLAVYLLAIRPRQLRWGATDEEVARAMPGDEIVARPNFDATRGVTVNAAPEHVWPWLVQMGINRAGWYSYDLIDNLGRPSATEILPRYQHLAVGDLVPMSPDGKLGLWVKDFEVNRWLLWWDRLGSVTWCWGLYATEDGQTRLISRVRMRYHWMSPAILFDLALDVGDIIMMRKCMLGIKARAETLARRENMTRLV